MTSLLLRELLNVWGGVVNSIRISDDDVSIDIDKGDLISFLLYLKFESCLRMDSLMDVFGLDFRGKEGNFEVKTRDVAADGKLCTSAMDETRSSQSLDGSTGFLLHGCNQDQASLLLWWCVSTQDMNKN